MPGDLPDDRLQAILKEAIAHLPYRSDDMMKLLNKGMSLIHQGRLEEGAACIDKVMEVGKRKKDIRLLEASYLAKSAFFMITDRHKDAVPYLEKLIHAIPNDGHTHYYMGVALFGMKRFEDALRHFDLSIRLHYNVPALYYMKGSALNECHRHRSALKCLKKFLRTNPDKAYAYCQMGISYVGLQKITHSIRCHKMAIKLDPSYFDSHVCLGIIYTMTKQYSLGRKHLDKAEKLAPEKSELLGRIAELKAICVANTGMP